MTADEVSGYEEGEFTLCTVCKDPINDVIYFPRNMDADDIHWIEKLFKCDSFTEFFVCEDCMAGHCGAVKGLTAKKWLQGHIDLYKKDPKQYDNYSS